MTRRRQGWRAQQRTYNHLTRELQQAAANERARNVCGDAIEKAHDELLAIHGEKHSKCVDQGPTTCPTWEAIHALRDSAKKIGLKLQTASNPEP